jgi:hypothetical protein
MELQIDRVGRWMSGSAGRKRTLKMDPDSLLFFFLPDFVEFSSAAQRSSELSILTYSRINGSFFSVLLSRF